MSEIKRVVVKPFDKDKFELAWEYEYQSASGETIKIPAGYKTNGANVPRIFWSIFPPNSPEYLSAVVAHDYLCDLERYERADEILKEIMGELRVAEWKILIFYYACRAYHKIKYGA